MDFFFVTVKISMAAQKLKVQKKDMTSPTLPPTWTRQDRVVHDTGCRTGMVPTWSV